MSERTCNLCLYQEMQRQAKDNGQTIEARPSPQHFFPDGVDVFVDGRWRTWFGIIPERCCC
jgi:hypothetical protein